MARRRQNETPAHADIGTQGLRELIADRSRAYATVKAECAAKGAPFIGIPIRHPLRAAVRMGDCAEQLLRIRRRLAEDPTSGKAPRLQTKQAELEAMIQRLADT